MKSVTKNTLKGFYSVLSGALKMAVYPYQLIKENPMQYISMPKYDEKKKDKEDYKIISLDEFNRIIKRFPKESNFYMPLQIAFHTGMRAAEVCGLTWDCIDLNEKKIKVEKILLCKEKEWIFGTPKTNTSQREIFIGKTLINILKKHRKSQMENKLKYRRYYTDNNFVCTRENGEFITTDGLKYLSRVVNYELGINFNFHSLRHTHATMLLESRANLKDIQNRLGHSKLSTTMDTYSHVTDKIKNDAVNILEKAINKK